jgi:hypothetical protein
VHGGFVYWATQVTGSTTGGRIRRAGLDGENPTIVADGMDHPGPLAIDGEYAFVLDQGKVLRSPALDRATRSTGPSIGQRGIAFSRVLADGLAGRRRKAVSGGWRPPWRRAATASLQRGECGQKCGNRRWRATCRCRTALGAAGGGARDACYRQEGPS